MEEERGEELVGGPPRPGEALALGGGLGPAFWLDAKRLAFPTGAGACVLDVQRGTQVRACARPPACLLQAARARPTGPPAGGGPGPGSRLAGAQTPPEGALGAPAGPRPARRAPAGGAARPNQPGGGIAPTKATGRTEAHGKG